MDDERVKPEWRVGKHYKIHVYEGERPVATFHNAEDAARAVDAVNRDRARRRDDLTQVVKPA